MVLSICVITKNEEKNIGKCLNALSGYDFELVVVDTGSTDRTIEIVKNYTDNLFHFAWQEDFAAAKNFAISKASNEYVMVIDSDEYLEKLTQKELDSLYRSIAAFPDGVGRIRRHNVYNRNGEAKENREWLNRIFSKEKFHYQGRIHEQVEAKNKKEYKTYTTPFIIEHSGYDLNPQDRRKKTQRNIPLLKQELNYLEEGKDSKEELGGKIPYVLYQLGKSYFMDEDYQSACTFFADGLSYDLDPKLEYVIDMVETYGYAMLNNHQPKNALFFENIYEEFGGSADFQFLMGLIYMNNEKYEKAVAEFKKAIRQKECRSVGVNSYSAWYNIGVIYECLGKTQEAIDYYKKCGKYKPALERLKINGN